MFQSTYIQCVCASTIQSSGASAHISIVLIENFHIIRFLSLSSSQRKKKFVDYTLLIVPTRFSENDEDDNCLVKETKKNLRKRERGQHTCRFKSHRNAVVDHPKASIVVWITRSVVRFFLFFFEKRQCRKKMSILFKMLNELLNKKNRIRRN